MRRGQEDQCDTLVLCGGRSLLEPVNGLSLWARQHRATIAEARSRFDAGQPRPAQG